MTPPPPTHRCLLKARLCPCSGDSQATPALCSLCGPGGASAVSICPSPRAQLLRPQLTGGRAEPEGEGPREPCRPGLRPQGRAGRRGAGNQALGAPQATAPSVEPPGQAPLVAAASPSKGRPPHRLLLGTWGRVLLASGGWRPGMLRAPHDAQQATLGPGCWCARLQGRTERTPKLPRLLLDPGRVCVLSGLLPWPPGLLPRSPAQQTLSTRPLR